MLDRSRNNTYLYIMNKLPLEKRVQIINLLVEGSSLRAISRIADVSINTVTKLLVDVGQACQKFHNETVKDVYSKRVQCDEIWSFVYSKDKNAPAEMKEAGTAGDAWTWVGIDADTKLVISFFVGNRDADSANDFMMDVASRLKSRVQLTTDGHKPYLNAVDNAFENGIDFAQLVKMYGGSGEGTSFEGIIPDVDTLRGLEEFCPGATKMWMELAQEEIRARHKNEFRITWTFKYTTVIGQVLGFITSLMVLTSGVYCIHQGHPTAGATIITGSAATVISAFFFRSRRKD